MSYHSKERNMSEDPLRIQVTMKITEDLLWYLSCIEEEDTLESKFKSVEDLLFDFCICEIECYERDKEALKLFLHYYIQ